MTHFAPAIHPVSNDIYLDDSQNLAVVRTARAVGQHARQRLKAFRGEWFLDIDAGVTWLTDIMGRRYDPALAEAVVKATLMDTDGVTSIEGFSVSFVQEMRNLDIGDIVVVTIYNEAVTI